MAVDKGVSMFFFLSSVIESRRDPQTRRDPPTRRDLPTRIRVVGHSVVPSVFSFRQNARAP